MSASTVYTKYLKKLTERFCEEVANSAAHREAIDSFGLVTARFGLTPSICVFSDCSISLTAIVSGDVAAMMQTLIDAGYAVGELAEQSLQYKGETIWFAPVSGHGIAFRLHFNSRDK